MNSVSDQTEARRRFLRMLVGTPFLASSHLFRSSLTKLLATKFIRYKEVPASLEIVQQSEDVITSPDQAFDVMDFEPAAHKALLVTNPFTFNKLEAGGVERYAPTHST
jgi:hypothetical protein